jgi:hypothetical protein
VEVESCSPLGSGLFHSVEYLRGSRVAHMSECLSFLRLRNVPLCG